MLRVMPVVAAARRLCAISAAMAAAAWPAATAAQAFRVPSECNGLASGNEGDDPVVLVVHGSSAQVVTSFSVLSDGSPPAWAVSISPYLGGPYNVFTTYTPFLTSDVLIQDLNHYTSYLQPLPGPGITDGRKWQIYPTYDLTITNSSNAPIPNAFVDFVPAFVGSSPLTIQANSNGVIRLYCVQQVSTGYHITVYDSDHNYLYDGSFMGSGTESVSAPRGPARGRSRPDPPK